jgi:hypothetical protein
MLGMQVGLTTYIGRKDFEMAPASQVIEQENFMPTEAERKYGLSQWIWRRLAYSGRVTSVKVGSRLLIPRSECERILAEGTRPRKEGVQVA